MLEHSSGRAPITLADHARFLTFMARHGLSLTTCVAVAKQLISERFRGDHWKRAALLDQLQCDLFCHIYRTERPDFATLFLNSTAHMQHSYWRKMQPELFKVKPTADEQSALGSAVLYGYEQMDRLVGRLLRALDPSCTIVLCSALSQQPCLIYEDVGGKTAYRPRNFPKFLKAVGIRSLCKVQPVMAHQFHLQFDSEAAAADAVKSLSRLRLCDGSRLVAAERKASAVFCGCAIFRTVGADAKMCVEGTTTAIAFDELLYRCVGLKSGMHHPDGVLWIRQPHAAHAVHPDRVPLDSVAPTLLSLREEPKPAWMLGDAMDLRPPAVVRMAEIAA